MDGGNFLHRYNLHYTDSNGNDRTYEMVSRLSEINDSNQLISHKADAVVMIVTDRQNEHMVLIHEYRMELVQKIYGLPGGKAGAKKESLSREHEAVLLDVLKDTRAYPFVFIALNTGMRGGEICGLKWDCVDLEKGIIYVRRNLAFNNTSSQLNEYLKTDCSVRDLPITPALEAELRKMKAKTNSCLLQR